MFDALLVISNKIVNKIIHDLGKVTKSPYNLAKSSYFLIYDNDRLAQRGSPIFNMCKIPQS